LPIWALWFGGTIEYMTLTFHIIHTIILLFLLIITRRTLQLLEDES